MKFIHKFENLLQRIHLFQLRFTHRRAGCLQQAFLRELWEGLDMSVVGSIHGRMRQACHTSLDASSSSGFSNDRLPSWVFLKCFSFQLSWLQLMTMFKAALVISSSPSSKKKKHKHTQGKTSVSEVSQKQPLFLVSQYVGHIWRVNLRPQFLSSEHFDFYQTVCH